MITRETFLAHIVNLTTRNGYIGLMPGAEVAAELQQRVDAQLRNYEDRMGRVYGFFMGQGLTDEALGGFVAEHLLGLGVDPGNAPAALQQIRKHLDRVEFLAFQTGGTGVRFAAVVNGDELTRANLSRTTEALNGIGQALLDLQGVWKIKLGGFKVGKGVGMDATGTALIRFSDAANFKYLRPVLDEMGLGTSAGEKVLKGIKSLFLNPLLFGAKGSLFFSRVYCRLFDGGAEVSGGFRAVTQAIPILDRFFYGFTLEDLMPRRCVSAPQTEGATSS